MKVRTYKIQIKIIQLEVFQSSLAGRKYIFWRMTVRPEVKTNKKGIHVKISKQTDLRYSPPDLVSASSESMHNHGGTWS